MPTLGEKGQENFTASMRPLAEKCLLTPENPRIPNILSGTDPQGSGIHPLAVPRPPSNPTLCLRVSRPGQAFPSFCSSRSTKFHQKEPKRGSTVSGAQGMRVGRSCWRALCSLSPWGFLLSCSQNSALPFPRQQRASKSPQVQA